MTLSDASAAVDAVQRLHARSPQRMDFASILKAVPPADDAGLAELIEADGRHLIKLGEPVDLERYFHAVPDLRSREVSLDAAIDVSLRSLSGSSNVTPQAVAALSKQWPDLLPAIRDAAMLNTAVWSTAGLQASIARPQAKTLPCEFGPLIASGSSAGQRRYQLQELLGQGGFGQVYLALDRQLSEEGHTAMVAIKILMGGNRSQFSRQRLMEEATKVRRISHPNVVVVMDRGVTEQDEDYIVYEYVDGGDLNALTTVLSLLPVREAAALMAKIARGVHAAHSAGVIHCDLKPSNIMLTAAKEPKVGDFGIAVRLSEQKTGPVRTFGFHSSDEDRNSAAPFRPIGSVAFISPEQYRVEVGGLSVPSDVYALGGIFFLLLTGELPNGRTADEIAKTHDAANGRTNPPAIRSLRPEVDRDLEAICQKAMAIDPADRYNSAATFAEDLQRWLNHQPILWRNPGMIHVLGLWSRRKPGLAIALAMVLLVTIVGATVALRLNSIANQNALDAAKKKLELDREQAARETMKSIATKYAESLRPTLGQYRISTEALVKIWALEYAYGPKVLGLPDQIGELWKNRILNIRNLIDSARQEGHGEDFETILWESALAFWLVNEKAFAEALPLLEGNIARWSRMLQPNDPWLADLRMMQTCATVHSLAAPGGGTRTDEWRSKEMRRLETELQTAAQNIPTNHRGTPMHFLLLNTMIDLYGPNLLNQPERRDALAVELKVILDNKPAKKTE